MTTVFLLQNQDKLLLNKHGEWVDGREAGGLYRAVHRDEAVNQMVEVNARDYTLRIQVLECRLNQRGNPCIDADDLPPPMPLVPEQAANDGQDDLESAELADAQEERVSA